MNRDKLYYRKMKHKKIRRRLNIIRSLGNCISQYSKGHFAKGHYGYMSSGTNTKTKAAHSHMPYRHKGTYGKAIQYTPHDQRLHDNYHQQLAEWEGGDTPWDK